MQHRSIKASSKREKNDMGIYNNYREFNYAICIKLPVDDADRDYPQRPVLIWEFYFDFVKKPLQCLQSDS